MSPSLYVLPTLLVALAVIVAGAPLGGPDWADYVLPVLPYMVVHVFLVRAKGVVLSPVMFLAGIAMDISSNGPLGFWALIYLFGVLIARQLPASLAATPVGRISGLLLVVFALAAAQVAVASVYQLRWVDWHGVLAGTVAAGAVAAVIDIVWRQRRGERGVNVTERGGARGAANV